MEENKKNGIQIKKNGKSEKPKKHKNEEEKSNYQEEYEEDDNMNRSRNEPSKIKNTPVHPKENEMIQHQQNISFRVSNNYNNITEEKSSLNNRAEKEKPVITRVERNDNNDKNVKTVNAQKRIAGDSNVQQNKKQNLKPTKLNEVISNIKKNQRGNNEKISNMETKMNGLNTEVTAMKKEFNSVKMSFDRIEKPWREGHLPQITNYYDKIDQCENNNKEIKIQLEDRFNAVNREIIAIKENKKGCATCDDMTLRLQNLKSKMDEIERQNEELMNYFGAFRKMAIENLPKQKVNKRKREEPAERLKAMKKPRTMVSTTKSKEKSITKDNANRTIPNYDSEIDFLGYKKYNSNDDLMLEGNYNNLKILQEESYFHIIQFGDTIGKFRFYFIPTEAEHDGKLIIDDVDIMRLKEAMKEVNIKNDQNNDNEWFKWWKEKMPQLGQYSYHIDDDIMRYGSYERANIVATYFVFPFGNKNLQDQLEYNEFERTKKICEMDKYKSSIDKEHVQILCIGKDFGNTKIYFVPSSCFGQDENYETHLKWLTKMQHEPVNKSDNVQMPKAWEDAWMWWNSKMARGEKQGQFEKYENMPLSFAFRIKIDISHRYVFAYNHK